MAIDHLMDEKRAIEFLAGKLREGTLVLVLGAGTSLGAGLPAWHTLVNRLRKKAGLVAVSTNATADDLQSAADQVRRDFCKGNDREFAQLVKACLYDGVTLSWDLLKNDLLIALGALMIGSRRGSVKRILTLNFDSVLEWYLTLHGFVPRVILQPPALEGAEDVRVYHPHGFLSHPDLSFHESDFVILGLESINLRLGTTGDPWFELMRHLLRTGMCLFVGLSRSSFRDRALAPLLTTVGKELQDNRPTGFWLLPGDGDDEQTREFLASNVVPLYYGGHEKAPAFLLSICRKAADVIAI
jgi:hypothetical protein